MKLNLIWVAKAERSFCHEVQQGNKEETRVTRFLEKLWDISKGPTAVRASGGNHFTRLVETFLRTNYERIEAFRFPAYCTELEPDKMMWATLKPRRLANYCPKTPDELKLAAQREMNRMHKPPQLVAVFFRRSESPLSPIP